MPEAQGININQLAQGKRFAIIYSVDDLFVYLVEIRDNQKSYYIGEKGSPTHFSNLDDAKSAALQHKAVEGYLGLSKTYQETDLSTTNDNKINRYDFLPIPLETT